MDGPDADAQLARGGIDAEPGCERPLDPLGLLRIEWRATSLLRAAAEARHDPGPDHLTLEVGEQGRAVFPFVIAYEYERSAVFMPRVGDSHFSMVKVESAAICHEKADIKASVFP